MEGVEAGFTECSLECGRCGARVPPDWPDDVMMRMVWDVPEACPGEGFVQSSMPSKI
jgi:hypothetical protein